MTARVRYISLSVAILVTLLIPVRSGANDGAQILRNFLDGGFRIMNSNPGRGQDARSGSRVSNDAGLDSKELYTAQRRLGELGYDVGRTDGKIGSRTTEAIRKFQSASGFTPTGRLTIMQFHHLMQEAGDTTATAAPQDEAPLSSDEMADMQRSLAALGFDIGTSDGKGGPKTGRAISKFLRDRGYDPDTTPVRTARQMVMEAAGTPELAVEDGVDGVGSAAAPAGKSGLAAMQAGGNYFDWSGKFNGYEADRAAFQQAITRRLIAIDPLLLDNPAVLQRWFEELSRGHRGDWAPPEAAALYKVYKDGSEFDKKKALDDFRGFMGTQGLADPLIVTRVRPVSLGLYDFASESFPLQYEDVGRQMTLYGAGYSKITAEASAWDVPNKLAMPKAEAERFAADLGGSNARSLHMAVRMKVGNFAVENDHSGQRTVFAEAIIEKITLHRPVPWPQTGLGPVIRQIEIKLPKLVEAPPAAPPATNTMGSWTRLGFENRDGRIVLPVAREGVYAERNDARTALTVKAMGLLGIGNMPDVPKSSGTAHRFSSIYATKEAYQSLFPPRREETALLREIAADPFKQDEILKKFNSEILPQIVAEAPRLPVRVLVAMPVELGGYDLTRQGFAITPSRLLLPQVSFRSNLNGQFPQYLKVPQARARKYVDQAKRSKVTAYYGFEMALTGVEAQLREHSIGIFQSGDVRTTVTGEVTGVALYEDADLKRLITRLPLYDFVPPPEVLPGTAIPEGQLLSRWNVSAITAELAGNPDLPRKLVESSRFVKEADEFNRPRLLEQALAQFAASQIDRSKPMYLMGEIKLGTHDGKNAFAIKKWQFAVTLGEKMQLDGGLTTVDPENSDALVSLPIERDAAQALVKDRPGRTFPAVFRVRPVRATELTGGNGPYARLDVAIEQIMLMDTKHTDRVTHAFSVGSRPDAGNADKVSLETTPSRLPLNPETSVLLSLAHSGTPLDDATLRMLLGMRWEEETRQRYDVVNTDPAPWGRFFPRNYRALTEADYTRLLPNFRRWTELRIASLPTQLRYENVYDDLGSNKYFGWPAREYVEALRELGISRRDFSQYQGHLFSPQQDQSGGSFTPKTILSLVRELKEIPADVYVPLENLPALPRGQFGRAVSIDLDVRKAIASGNRPDGRPFVVLDAVPTEIRWFGDKSAVTPRSMIAKFSIAPIAPRLPQVVTVPDITGVRIGMSREEAETILRDQIKFERILELKGNPTNPNEVAESARLYVGASGTDLIGVLYGPSALEPKVYGMARSLYFLHGMTQEQVLGALEKKYGARSQPSLWRWGESADMPICGHEGTPNAINWTGAAVVEGPPLMMQPVTQQQMMQDPAIAAEIRLIRRIAYFNWGFSVQNIAEQCGPVVTARFQPTYRVGNAGERIPDGETSILWSWLFDHTLHQAALMEGSKATKKTADIIDLKL
ncbi:peptidoglycan-binding domain-containing protein [Neorhizobium sp. LjRoot104]|uniref:peptidoglycan-binding domain-containing protein n=1 Tax=Neorhizobium sp. LjRoot104 TaxID=3342254 RepID=UPI003ED14BD7